MNIIGDVHGEYDALVKLAKKMPDDEFISVGDMIDRGAKSKEVMDFFRKNGRAVLGNHEHQLLDLWNKGDYYDCLIWGAFNGGFKTLTSMISFVDDIKRVVSWNNEVLFTVKYGKMFVEEGILDDMIEGFSKDICDLVKEMIPKDYIDWLQSLPLYIDEDGVFISHAAKNPELQLEDVCDLRYGPNNEYAIEDLPHKLKPKGSYNDNILWNTGNPRRMKDKYQVHGHKRQTSPWKYMDQFGEFGINIDTVPQMLTGIHLPSKKVYQEEIG